MRKAMATLLTGALALAGCGEKTPELPAASADRAAACSALQLAGEQERAGPTGHLSADAQERVLHYALIGATHDGSFDDQVANGIIKQTPDQFARMVKGKWQTLKPGCAAAYPAAAIATPALPAGADERALQCYAVADFMRKALGQYEGRYAEATAALSVLADKYDGKVAAIAKRDGLKGEALTARKSQALAAAATLGPPPAVIAACGEKVG